MKNMISQRMEAQPSRVVGMLLLVLVVIPGIVLCVIGTYGLGIRTLGYDPTPPHKKLRVGMSTADVRAIMGEPDGIATLNHDGTLREDWWYPNDKAMQLTFEADRLVGNHSKDHLRGSSDESENLFPLVFASIVFVTLLSLFSAYQLLRKPRPKSLGTAHVVSRL